MIIIRPLAQILISTSIVSLALLLASATPIPSHGVISGADGNALVTRDPSSFSITHAQSETEFFPRGSQPDEPTSQTGGDSSVVSRLEQLTRTMHEKPASEEAMVKKLQNFGNLIHQLEEKDCAVSRKVFKDIVRDVLNAIVTAKYIVMGFRSKKQDAVKEIEACEVAALAKGLQRPAVYSVTTTTIEQFMNKFQFEDSTDINTPSWMDQFNEVTALVTHLPYLPIADQRKMREELETKYESIRGRIHERAKSENESNPTIPSFSFWGGDRVNDVLLRWERANSLVKVPSK
ncbi:hypothetical protein H0H93_008567 [Arthromyces matolae]|nr:hypothetical protein H0H93_008567 [Arthromyces matolae]